MLFQGIIKMDSKNSSKNEFIIEIHAKPKSKISKIEWDSELRRYLVMVTSHAMNGKANREILKILKKYFLAQSIVLVKGHKSTIKRIKLNQPKKLPKY